MWKTPAIPLAVKRGADLSYRVRFTAQQPANLAGWNAEMVVRDDAGNQIFLKSTLLTADVATPHVGVAVFQFDETETSTLQLGNKTYHYHVKLSSGEWSEIYVHGNLDVYVRSGGPNV